MAPTTLEVMMMLPPSFMRGRPYLQARKAPRTCTAICASKASSGYSVTGVIGPWLPALLNSTSIGPNLATVRSM